MLRPFLRKAARPFANPVFAFADLRLAAAWTSRSAKLAETAAFACDSKTVADAFAAFAIAFAALAAVAARRRAALFSSASFACARRASRAARACSIISASTRAASARSADASIFFTFSVVVPRFFFGLGATARRAEFSPTFGPAFGADSAAAAAAVDSSGIADKPRAAAGAAFLGFLAVVPDCLALYAARSLAMIISSCWASVTPAFLPAAADTSAAALYDLGRGGLGRPAKRSA